MKPIDNMMLLASQLDALNILIWQKTKDGAKGKNKPESVVDKIKGDTKKEVVAFSSAEEFEAQRKRILHGD